MHAIVTLTIDEQGDQVFLRGHGAEPFLDIGTVQTQRASHVEPARRDLRRWFYILRFIFGDKGRVSDWTRRWVCFWRVNMSPVGGPIICDRWGRTRLWTNRELAIEAEIEFLNKFFLGEENESAN